LRKALKSVITCVCTFLVFCGSAYSNDQEDPYIKQEKAWTGKSGRSWHIRSDDLGRLISFKLVGGRVEFQLLYADTSNKAVAVRIAGRSNWMYRPASAMFNSGGSCANDGLSKGVLPDRAFKPSFLKGVGGPNNPLAIKPPTFLKVMTPEEEEYQNNMILALEAYMNLQLITEDWYASFWIFDPLAATPEQIQQCIQACDDTTDLAWIVCAGFGVFGGPGAVVGGGCALYYYNKREDCRTACRRK